MGICSAKLCAFRISPKSNDGSPRDTGTRLFSDRQKAIIVKTWRYMGNDLTGRGSKVFMKIFELHPEVKQLFPSLKDYEGEALLKNPNFKGHASRFMQAVGAVVEHIDSPDTLSPVLVSLGQRHVTFSGFTPAYFAAFTEGMMSIWAQELGKTFTEEVSEAWKTVFDFIMSSLQDGYLLTTAEGCDGHHII